MDDAARHNAAAGSTPVGVVGLGLLGGAIAARLVERGFNVTGHDVSPARRDIAAQAGIAVHDDAATLVDACDPILLSLPDGDAVARVLSHILPRLRAGQTVIDTTTASPEQMVAHAELLRRAGVALVEAEVAGSSAQARRGEALLFVAGVEAEVAKVQDTLAAFSAGVHYLGPPGSAARMKLVHNLVLGLHRAVLAEGLTFAESLGLNAARVLELLRRSPAASAVMATKGAKMAARDFAPQATVRQHLKDVRLILAEAARHGAHTPLSTAHAALLERAMDLGHAEDDNSAVIAAFPRSTAHRAPVPPPAAGRHPD